MSRVRLKEYQNSYAEQMAKYGLQRGVDGSEAKHVTTSQYYRDLLTQSESVQENISDLLEQKQQAEQELFSVKADIKQGEVEQDFQLLPAYQRTITLGELFAKCRTTR